MDIYTTVNKIPIKLKVIKTLFCVSPFLYNRLDEFFSVLLYLCLRDS